MLSEEEKKAIEIFTDLINYLEKWNKNLTVVPEDKKYYDTVLNLITKLRKENEEKDKQIKTLKHTNKTYKGMLNKQSKQIDLMAGEIEYAGCIKKVWECDEKDCIDCIKQYFETKVKKGE